MRTIPGKARSKRLEEFVLQSWAIERRVPSSIELERTLALHRDVIDQQQCVSVSHLVACAQEFRAGGRLRDQAWLDAIHCPFSTPSGPEVARHLDRILESARTRHPYHVHIDFQELRPLSAGNGPAGRLLWLWSMEHREFDWSRGFLETWYHHSIAFDDLERSG